MSDILENILEQKRSEITALKNRYTRTALSDLVLEQGPARGFQRNLSAKVKVGGAGVIAEIKKASPSKGLIRADFDPAWIANEYEEGGAACLSILTDEKFFQGHNDYLKTARAACALPVIRKDFLISDLQILEARAIGADCVLLIAAALSPAQLAELYACARELRMDVLVEIHNREELQQVLSVSLSEPLLLGINNRNLRTFETTLQTTLALLPLLPKNCEVVTESGIAAPADVQRMRDADVHRFLIGESLMRQPSPGKALRELIVG